MKNKNGFTIVELIATIAIIGVLSLLIVPNVVNNVLKTKKTLFYDEIINVYNNAYDTFNLNRNGYTVITSYCVSEDNVSNTLNITMKNNYYYKVELNNDGQIIELLLTNGTFYYEYVSDGDYLKKSNIKMNDVKEGNLNITCE